MSCCAPGTDAACELERADQAGPSAEELRLAARRVGPGALQSDLSVPGVHCAGCIHSIETALKKLPGVEAARVNLSTKRLSRALEGGGAAADRRRADAAGLCLAPL